MSSVQYYLFVAGLVAAISTTCYGIGTDYYVDEDSKVCGPTVSGELGNLCGNLFEILESAILESKGNINRLRKAFLYVSHADPILVRVEYFITFGENITRTLDPDDQLEYCEGNKSENETYDIVNSTSNYTQLSHGWTSIGIYTVIHPSILSLMQFQIPVVILRIIRYVYKNINGYSPHSDVFLWDGLYDLPSVSINLHIEGLPCLPSDKLFGSVLQDITALVRVYAATSVHSEESADLIGYSTHPNVTTTANYVFFYKIGTFVLSLNIFLALAWVIFAKIFGPQFGPVLISVFENAIGITKGFAGLLFFTVLLETVLGVIYSIIWCINSDWTTIAIICIYCIISRIVPFVALLVAYFIYKFDLSVHCWLIQLWFVNDKWNIGLYCVLIFVPFILPTFLLLLIFPTDVIAITAYFFAFYFALTIVSVEYKWSRSKYSVLCILFITFSYIFFLMSIILYFVFIEKASNVSIGFYGILSLIPSTSLGVITWLYKKNILNTNRDNPNGGNTAGDNPNGGNTDGDNPNGGNLNGHNTDGDNLNGNNLTAIPIELNRGSVNSAVPNEQTPLLAVNHDTQM